MLKLQLKNRPTNIRESRRSKGSTPRPFLMRRSWCAKGNRCDFLHAKSPIPSFGEQKNRVPCPFLKRKGYCLKGNVCDFSHDDSLPNVPVSWHNYSTSPFFFNHRGPMNLGPQGMQNNQGLPYLHPPWVPQPWMKPLMKVPVYPP